MASMNRPSLNPMFMEDAKPRPKKEPRWKKVLRGFGRTFRLLFVDIFGRKKEQLRDETGTAFSRLVRKLLYRLMFVPTLLAIMIAFMVVTATHPQLAPAVSDPASEGVHFEPVELSSLDGTKLEAWLVPVVDARRVIREKEDVLHRRYAAVVLVHDFAMSRQQTLPMLTPLYEAGFVTFSVNLRGQGPSSTTGSTFGINEAQDVRAAVDFLRKRAFIDPDAIGVLGIGTGATAALLAAKEDPRIKVLVLDHPVRAFEDILNDRLGPSQPWLSWVKPMCKWAFEIGYKVDAEEINLDRYGYLMKNKPVLLMDDNTETVSCIKPQRSKQVVDFLKKHLIPKRATAGVRIIQREGLGAGSIRSTGNKPVPIDGDESWPPQKRAADMLDRAW